jgi:hypothetical protein
MLAGMKSRYLILTSLLTLCGSPAAFPQGPATLSAQSPAQVEAELRQLNADYVKSFVKSDVARYDQLLAAEFRSIAPSGVVIDRAAFLKAAAQPSGMASFTAEDVTVQIVGSAGDVAVIQARTPYKRLDGTTGESRYTDVWVRRDGRWQTLLAQITPVRAP